MCDRIDTDLAAYLNNQVGSFSIFFEFRMWLFVVKLFSRKVHSRGLL